MNATARNSRLHAPDRPRGLLEPCAATSGKHGSEEGGAGKRRPLSDNGLHHRRDTTLAEDASQLRAGQSWRLFASIANTTVSVLNRAGYPNHAAARRDLGWDRTGLQALALLGL